MSVSVKRHDDGVIARVRESAEKFLSAIEKKFAIRLDYSEPSLHAVDMLLSLFFKERRCYDLAVSLLGSYLGETVIANLGGKWDPRDLSVVKIGKMKGTAYPFRQARRRFDQGLGESLIPWYVNLKIGYCRSGEFSWDGHIGKRVSEKLFEQGWDVTLLQRLLNNEERPHVREEAAHVLGRLKAERAGAALVEALYSPERAYYACIALQGIREPAALPMLRALCKKKSDPAVRIQAIQAVGEHRDREMVEPLVEMLAETDEIICHYAAQALGKIGGEPALESLLEIVENKRPGNKVSAISALELIADRASIPSLTKCLFDGNEDVAEAAVRALQYIPDSRALPSLLRLLDAPSSKIRTLAAYALAFLGDAAALESVKKLLKDPVKEVREHAAYLIPLLETGRRPAGFCW